MKHSDLKLTGKEIFSSEIASIKNISLADAKQMFPQAEFANSENITYFPFVLCNSFPKINSRGRLFTPKVLRNSFSTIIDQLVDVEHKLVEHGNSYTDDIVGHVKAVKFDYDSALESQYEMANISNPLSNPLPVVGLGCIYNRSQKAQKVLEYANKNKLSVSMECGHLWSDAQLYYDGKFVPITECDEAMIDCIESDKIRPYKGKELAVALGGLEGHVDFWGVALTVIPADKDAPVFGFVSGKSKELASRKIFYMPLESIQAKSFELANKEIETKITELANIGVIGQTEEADGHKHDILSNLTIMSTNNHSHDIREVNISVGTKPKLTGVTNDHYGYLRNETNLTSVETSHKHLVAIDLKQKTRGTETEIANSEIKFSLDDTNSIKQIEQIAKEFSSQLDSIPGEILMSPSIQDLLKKLSEKTIGFGTAKTDEERKLISSEMASIGEELKKSFAGEEFSKRIKEEIDKKIQAKELFTAEDAKQLVDAAVKEKQEAFDIKEKELKTRSERLQKCTEAGINLDFEFEGIKNGDKPLTIRDHLDTIDVDEKGEKSFIVNFTSWKQLLEKEKKEAEDTAAAKSETEKAEEKKEEEKKEEEKVAEAASRTAKLNTIGKGITIGGGGPSGKKNEDSPVGQWFKF